MSVLYYRLLKEVLFVFYTTHGLQTCKIMLKYILQMLLLSFFIEKYAEGGK